MRRAIVRAVARKGLAWLKALKGKGTSGEVPSGERMAGTNRGATNAVRGERAPEAPKSRAHREVSEAKREPGML